jgi:hypothetical protein
MRESSAAYRMDRRLRGPIFQNAHQSIAARSGVVRNTTLFRTAIWMPPKRGRGFMAGRRRCLQSWSFVTFPEFRAVRNRGEFRVPQAYETLHDSCRSVFGARILRKRTFVAERTQAVPDAYLVSYRTALPHQGRSMGERVPTLGHTSAMNANGFSFALFTSDTNC